MPIISRLKKIELILSALNLTDKKAIRKVSEMKSRRLDVFLVKNNIKINVSKVTHYKSNEHRYTKKDFDNGCDEGDGKMI